MRITFIFLLTATCLVFLSNKGGRNQACTGAPFENNSKACAECHSGGNFTPSISYVLRDSLGNAVDSYQPGSTYNLEMTIGATVGTPKTYGFQAVLVDDNNAQAGTFVSLGDKVRKLTLSNRTYLTQISPLASGLFTAKWKAPSEAKNLHLYISGLATNGNNNTSGDKATTSAFTLAAGITATNNYEVQKPEIAVNGNTIRWNVNAEKAEVFDMAGRSITIGSGQELTMPSVIPGIYILALSFEGQTKTIKFFH